ncbi:MAG: hypothetical protein IJR47_02190, partial [Clostridia bacterium]|nr:hypothetical protein [Clostridia bacterium]
MQFKRVIKMMGAAAMLIAFSAGLYACTRSSASAGSNTPESFTEPPTSVLYVNEDSNFGDFNGSTFKVGDKLMYGGSDYTGTVEYEIKAVNIHNDLNGFNLADLDMLDGENFVQNGKIKEGYKFIVVDIGATCLKASKDDYEGMKNAQCIACFHPSIDEEITSEYQRPIYKYSSEL